nr:hypothetical protein Iba_chr05cCG9850 [Ipomoea batatas]
MPLLGVPSRREGAILVREGEEETLRRRPAIERTSESCCITATAPRLPSTRRRGEKPPPLNSAIGAGNRGTPPLVRSHAAVAE